MIGTINFVAISSIVLKTRAKDLSRQLLRHVPKRNRDIKRSIPPLVKSNLRLCAKDLRTLTPVQLTPPPVSIEAFTDASMQGWGLHYGNSQLNGQWSQTVSHLHINVLEMMVVLILTWRMTAPLGSHVLVHCDNTMVVRVIRRGGSRSRHLKEIYS